MGSLIAAFIEGDVVAAGATAVHSAPAYSSIGVAPPPSSAWTRPLTPLEVETGPIAAAIVSGDLDALRAHLPQAASARREKLRRTHAITFTFVHGRTAIARQILRWDPEALVNLSKEQREPLIVWCADSWQRSELARRGGRASPSDADHLALMKMGLEAGLPPDGISTTRETALQIFAAIPPSEESVAAVQLLIRYGASLQGSPETKQSALERAAQTGNLPMVQVILAAGAPKPMVDQALARASPGDRDGVRSALLQAGADLKSLGSERNEVDSPIVTIALKGKDQANRALLKSMLLRKPDVSARPGRPSPVTVFLDDPDLLDLALKAGGDPNHRDAYGNTPMLLATQRPSDAPPVPKSDDRSLRLRVVRLLLDAGADPSLANQRGATPLMQTLPDERELVALLMDRGARARSTTNEGPVVTAIRNRNDALGEALVKKFALAGNDREALYWAAFSGSSLTLAALIDAKASPTLDNQGRTPLIAACAAGRTESVRLLLDRNASSLDETTPVRTRTGWAGPEAFGGVTALMTAVIFGHADTVRELVRRGANVDAKDASGLSARHYARGSRGEAPSPQMAAALAGN